MKPTIRPGDKVTADMSAYADTSPKRWDIVVFHPVDERYKDALWAMRVVGLPGERITFAPGGSILIDDKALQQPAEISSIEYSLPSHDPFSVVPDATRAPIPHSCGQLLRPWRQCSRGQRQPLLGSFAKKEYCWQSLAKMKSPNQAMERTAR
jgi:signal peptidase I